MLAANARRLQRIMEMGYSVFHMNRKLTVAYLIMADSRTSLSHVWPQTPIMASH